MHGVSQLHKLSPLGYEDYPRLEAMTLQRQNTRSMGLALELARYTCGRRYSEKHQNRQTETTSAGTELENTELVHVFVHPRLQVGSRMDWYVSDWSGEV